VILSDRPSRMVPVRTLRGTTIYVDPDDGRGAELVKTSGDYNPASLDLWSAVVGSHPWDLVVDIGANYGEMLVTPTLPPRARIVAFEPNDHLRPYLSRTLDEAGIQVSVEPTAVADSLGTATFHVDQAWSGTSSLVGTDTGRSVDVELTTLDHHFSGSGHRSACVKIDVEGAESRVLDGGGRFFSSLSRTALMVEIIHQPSDVLMRLARQWRLYLYDLRLRRLVRVSGHSADGIEQMRTSGWVHQLDGLLLPAGRDLGWRPL
jgi:FkbM family methyltransferase